MEVNTREDFYSMHNVCDQALPKECGCCGATENLTIHHIVPLSVGGTNRISNLVRLCEECHGKIHGTKIYCRELQKIGIEQGKKNGVTFGRPKKIITQEFKQVYAEWKRGAINVREAMTRVNMKPNTFYRRVREYELNKENER